MSSAESNSLFNDYCLNCFHYDAAIGVCSQIHENVRNYPKKFIKKCNGKFFTNDTTKSAPIRNDLVEEIAEPETAENLEENKVLANKYARTMLYGVIWAVGGTIVTMATYSAASKGGGTYVVAWGAILFGIFDFFKGLFGWLKYKE